MLKRTPILPEKGPPLKKYPLLREIWQRRRKGDENYGSLDDDKIPACSREG
jgi:hypothetical protein